MAYIELIKGDIFDLFPDDIRSSPDPEWRQLADSINELRDILVFEGDPVDGSLSIEDLDLLFICERIPARMLTIVGQMFDAGILSEDSERVAREKICRAVAYHRRHGTVWLIRTLIEEVTGITPDILAFSTFNRGWDEDDTVLPPTYTIDFLGGLFWDETEEFVSLNPDGDFIWSILPAGILVDVKNDGNYTAEQWEQILQIVAEQKQAQLAAEVGYFDTGTGEKVIYQVVYSENLSQTDWEDLADPGP